MHANSTNKYFVAQVTTHSVQLVFQRANGPLSLPFLRHLGVVISGLFLSNVCYLHLHVYDLPVLEPQKHYLGVSGQNMVNQLWFTSLSSPCWFSFSFIRAAHIMSSSSNRARRVLVSSLSRWRREKFLQLPRFWWSSSCSFWSFSISCLSSHYPNSLWGHKNLACKQIWKCQVDVMLPHRCLWICSRAWRL